MCNQPIQLQSRQVTRSVAPPRRQPIICRIWTPTYRQERINSIQRIHFPGKIRHAALILTIPREYLFYRRRLGRPRYPYRHCGFIDSLILEANHKTHPKIVTCKTKLELKGSLNLIKGKLKQKRSTLTNYKLTFAEGKSGELPGLIQRHTSKTLDAIKNAGK